MQTYKYKNYQEYKDAQISANKKKASRVWAKEENIKAICDYIGNRVLLQGLCHGTRGGYEQAWFNKYLPHCKTIGSEIGDASAADTVQWDFNKENPDWINKFDFIYSNSFDHAFNPQETFNIWVDQLKSGGFLIFEYDKRQEHKGDISKAVNKTDPVSIPIDELIELAQKWNDKIKFYAVVDMPIVTMEWRKAIIFEKAV